MDDADDDDADDDDDDHAAGDAEVVSCLFPLLAVYGLGPHGLGICGLGYRS